MKRFLKSAALSWTPTRNMYVNREVSRARRAGGHPELEVALGLVQRGDTIMDIGASWGLFALTFAEAVGPSGKVIAIEPNPEVFRDLRKLTQRTAVTPICCAAGAQPGHLQLNVPVTSAGSPATPYGSLAHTWPGPVRSYDVDVVRIDDLAGQESIVSLIKIDVEGWEFEALAGAAQTISRHRPPIVIEAERRHLRETGRDLPELFEWATTNGYTFRGIGPQGLMTEGEFDIDVHQCQPAPGTADNDAFIAFGDRDYVYNFLLSPTS